MTTAPGFTAAAPSSRGTPTAATRMSAWEQTASRSRVREWHIVTVAFAISSRRATGTPTSFERPTTTAWAPSSSTPSWASSSITPAGVHGVRPGVPWASRPALTGVRPSTSFSGSMIATIRSESRWSGSGIWTRIPSTSSSAFNSSTSASSSSWRIAASGCWWIELIPTSSQARTFIPT